MKVHITIQGGVTRPTYNGHVDLPDNYTASVVDIRKAVVEKLNRTSYSGDKLNYRDVRVNMVEWPTW